MWNQRLGQVNQVGLNNCARNIFFVENKISNLDFCGHSVAGKSKKFKSGTLENKSEEILDYVNLNFWGLARSKTKKSNVFLIFYWDYSKKIWVYFLEHKYEVFEKL